MSPGARAFHACAGLALAVLFVPAAATGSDAPVLSSARDYSIDSERHAPITCKDGDIAPHRGRTLAALFGADWPAQPVPATPGAHRRPGLLAVGRVSPPRGLEGESALVVVATLVDASGRPVRAEAVCLTTPGFAVSAQRAARASRFSPARINGEPVTSVAMVVLAYRAPAATAGPGSTRRGGVQ